MTLESLYRDTPLPLPSRPLEIDPLASMAEACDRLDGFFVDIANNYTHGIRNFLKRMYYEEKNVFHRPGMLQAGKQATSRISIQGKDMAPKMFIDEQLAGCPLFSRCIKIHEIGGHLGQMLSSIAQNGLDNFTRRLHGPDFERFLEQSIAPVDRELYTALPANLVAADMLYIRDTEVRALVWDALRQEREMDHDDYIRLKHRESCAISAALTEDHHRLLYTRPDMAAYDQRLRARGDGEPVSQVMVAADRIRKIGP